MPAYQHGRNAKILVTESAGSTRDVSGDSNSVTLTFTRDNPDVTTFGQDSHQRIGGLHDVTMTGAYVWNGAESCGIPQVFDNLISGSYVTLVSYAPGGSISGCPVYTACMLVNSHSHTAGVNAAVAGNWSMQLASGSLTSGSVP